MPTPEFYGGREVLQLSWRRHADQWCALEMSGDSLALPIHDRACRLHPHVPAKSRRGANKMATHRRCQLDRRTPAPTQSCLWLRPDRGRHNTGGRSSPNCTVDRHTPSTWPSTEIAPSRRYVDLGYDYENSLRRSVF